MQITLNMTNARKVTKNVVAFLAGAGTYKITTTIIENNMDEEDKEKLRDRAAIHVGSATLGAIVAENAKAYTDKRIDQIFDSIESTVSLVTGSKPS